MRAKVAASPKSIDDLRIEAFELIDQYPEVAEKLAKELKRLVNEH